MFLGGLMHGNPPMILIVEDDPPIALLERRVLEDAGFAIDEVRRGDRALQSLEGSQYKAVLLDYRLPDMTGAEVVAALGDRIRSLPVVMVTGYAQAELREEMLRSGVAGYLVKDTNLDFLRDLPMAIESALERFGGASTPPPTKPQPVPGLG